MNTKLTLNIENSIIERAKSYAENSGKSLSELIENYLENIIQDSQEEHLSPKLKKIVGAVKLPYHFDEDKELSSYFEKKHL